jgi:hypothetical protein
MKEIIVPINIIGIKGIFFFFMLLLFERILIKRNIIIPINDDIREDKINPGIPEIKPQKKL